MNEDVQFGVERRTLNNTIRCALTGHWLLLWLIYEMYLLNLKIKSTYKSIFIWWKRCQCLVINYHQLCVCVYVCVACISLDRVKVNSGNQYIWVAHFFKIQFLRDSNIVVSLVGSTRNGISYERDEIETKFVLIVWRS